MFSVRQKREIADKVQQVLRETNHPELPEGEIRFLLHVEGTEDWSWADIRNNGSVSNPGINPWNERQDPQNETSICDICNKQFPFDEGVIHNTEKPQLLCKECIERIPS